MTTSSSFCDSPVLMPYSILVVDDSVIYRKALTKILLGMSDVGEVRQASNGKEGVKLYNEKNADLVTMDVEMPLMNGIEALKEILNVNPKAKVIMISSVTKRGAGYTIDALSAGAADFITKEQAFGLRDEQAETLGETLQEKFKTVLEINFPPQVDQAKPVFTPKVTTPTPEVKKVYSRNIIPSPVNLLLVGSSTGGPPALTKLLHGMKAKRNYATVIVQHMPPMFTAQLADNLSKVCKKNVVEASEGLVLEKDLIVIAPGGSHLELRKRGDKWVCAITDSEPVKSCKPSVDVTFQSVARQIITKEVVAMIMTGMGDDGVDGCEELVKNKIPILTQERTSCTVYGMPKAVDERNLACRHATPPFLINEAEKFMLHPGQL